MAELTPYLTVGDARAAVEWYVAHLGAVVTFDPLVMPDGRIGHVELAVQGAGWMMADEHPELGAAAPLAGQGAAVTLHLTADARDDVDELASRAVEGGAVLDRGPQDTEHGRIAVLHDPFGHRWLISGPQ